MNKTITNRTIAAAAFGAAAVLSLLSSGGSAEAASVASCKGSSRAAVVSCCERLVKKNGRPFWMIQSGTNCQAATVCHSGKGGIPGIAAVAAKPCHIQIVQKIKEGGGELGDGKQSER